MGHVLLSLSEYLGTEGKVEQLVERTDQHGGFFRVQGGQVWKDMLDELGNDRVEARVEELAHLWSWRAVNRCGHLQFILRLVRCYGLLEHERESLVQSDQDVADKLHRLYVGA